MQFFVQRSLAILKVFDQTYVFATALVLRSSVVDSKVLIDLFQKVAVSRVSRSDTLKASAFGRALRSAKRSHGVFFLRDLPAKQGNVRLSSFVPFVSKEKAD